MAVLTLALLTCALAVVNFRHHSRLLFVELQSLQAERDALNVEWGRLLLEQGAWSEHRRVEGMARARLGMAIPGPEQVVTVYALRAETP